MTGGVHGYETSGVQGALAFLATEAHRYNDFDTILTHLFPLGFTNAVTAAPCRDRSPLPSEAAKPRRCG